MRKAKKQKSTNTCDYQHCMKRWPLTMQTGSKNTVEK